MNDVKMIRNNLKVVDQTPDFSFGRVGSYHMETALFICYILSQKQATENKYYLENTSIISSLYLLYQGVENTLKNIIFNITVNKGLEFKAIKEGHNLVGLVEVISTRSEKLLNSEDCDSIKREIGKIEKRFDIFKLINDDFDIVHQLVRFGSNLREKKKIVPVMLSLGKGKNLKIDFFKLYEEMYFIVKGLEQLNNYSRILLIEYTNGTKKLEN